MAAEHQPTSESLMRRYQERLDEAAFEQLVGRFLSPALAVACQLLPERQQAEDAVQETFLRLVRRRERYDPSRPFATWFYAILRNVCIDMLRRRARREQAVQEACAEQARREPGPPPSLDPFALLAHLGEDDRTVLTLRVVQDMPFRDVAAALGISEEAAKKRGQRALRRLRALAEEAQARLAARDKPRTSCGKPVPTETSRAY